jgi:multiple RNA-binding domain-containing protein 1
VQAQDAIRYFNNTFIETSRVTVEEAKKVGDQELLENARSRHTKKKLEKLVKAQEKDKKDKKDQEKAAAAPVAKAKAPPKDGRMSKEKRDFMEAMKPKKDKKFWGNDESGPAMDVEGAADAAPDDVGQGGGEGVDDDSDADDDDDDVNDLTAMSTTQPKQQKQQESKSKLAPPEKVVKGTMTDMDYLRSKVRAHFSDEESDGDDDEEDAKSTEGGNTDSKASARGDEEEENIEDEEEDESAKEADAGDGSGDPVVPGDDDDDSGRLFVRNLIFSCSEDEMRALFEAFGPLASVHLPLDNEKKGKGFGFVQFVIPEQAQRARVELDGSSFQGRLLHVIAAKKAPEVVPDETKRSQQAQGRMSAFQLKREEERRAQAGSKDGWNASFVRSDAVVDALAERYGVARNEILDRTEGGGEMAVRLAIGEAQVMNRTVCSNLLSLSCITQINYPCFTVSLFRCFTTSSPSRTHPYSSYDAPFHLPFHLPFFSPSFLTPTPHPVYRILFEPNQPAPMACVHAY